MTLRTALTLLVLTLSTVVARADDAATTTAKDAVTFQPEGPRKGPGGRAFLNVEGKNNAKYTAFGVIEFTPAKPARPAAKVASITLTLTQSVARFTKNGALKLWLTEDVKTSLSVNSSPLKFDPKIDGGVGEQLGKLIPLGATTFTKHETGQVDALKLIPSADASTLLLRQLNAGRAIRLVVTPADDDVAATYFGPDADPAGQRPKLAFETAE